MFRRRIKIRRFAPLRLCVIIATALAVLGLESRLAGAADFIYVSMDNDTIVRYDVSLGSSALVQAAGNVFVPTGQGLNLPIGLTFDSAGNLNAANIASNIISKYDSAGVLQFSWSTVSDAPRFLAFPTVVPESTTCVSGAIATALMAVIARQRRQA